MILPFLNTMQEAPLTGLGYADPVPRNVISIMCNRLGRLGKAKYDGSLTLRSLNAQSQSGHRFLAIST